MMVRACRSGPKAPLQASTSARPKALRLRSSTSSFLPSRASLRIFRDLSPSSLCLAMVPLKFACSGDNSSVELYYWRSQRGLTAANRRWVYRINRAEGGGERLEEGSWQGDGTPALYRRRGALTKRPAFRNSGSARSAGGYLEVCTRTRERTAVERKKNTHFKTPLAAAAIGGWSVLSREVQDEDCSPFVLQKSKAATPRYAPSSRCASCGRSQPRKKPPMASSSCPRSRPRR